MLVHLLAASAATTPQHDGLVTLELAAGGLEDWQALTDAPAWRPASAYLDVAQRTTPTPPAVVAHQVAELDIHPPGYPLLISVWQPLAGRSMTMLLLVNVVAAGILCWLAFGLATRLGASPPLAAVAGIGAAASPGLVVTGLELRPYLVAAAVAVALASWGVSVVADSDDDLRARRWLLGAGLTALLALVNYAGAFVAAGTGLAVALLGGPLRRRVTALSAMAAGGVAALLAWPHVFDQLAEQSRRQANPLFEAAATRSGHLVRSLASPVWYDAATWVAAVLVVLLAALVIIACRRRGRPAVALAVIAATGVVGHAAFYLLGRSQRWAMSPKYIAFVLPLVAVLAVMALRGRRRAVTAVVVVAAGVGLNWPAIVDVLEDAPPAEVATVDAVMVTNPRRGVGPRQLWHVPPDVPAAIGPTGALAGLLDEVPGCRWLLVHNTQGSPTRADADAYDERVRAKGWELTGIDPPSRLSRAAIATRDDCGSDSAPT